MSDTVGDSSAFEALLFLSFGGPERVEDVRPFLENVTRGRGVPPERFEEVVQHYLHFGGVSPINRLNLAMIDALGAELTRRGRDLPIYFGNRNWHPMAAEATRRIYDDGHRRVLVFPTSAWGGYSGCRQYHEDIAAALGAGLPADDPSFVMRKLPQFSTESKFIEAAVSALRTALGEFERTPRVVFTAHSIPTSADRNAGPAVDGGHLYSRQVRAAAAAVAQALGIEEFDVVWQSRSGPPQIPWLEPDICDHLRDLAADGVRDVAVMPIGFVSDHLEVIWDLDAEARGVADDLGLNYVRVPTVGTDPTFISLIADLVERYVDGGGDTAAMGCGDNGALCRPDCCVPARRPARSTA
ncbi:ferrochelatase [Gordonia sp. (in: high G+C Gram-positive bacteria)]|uniref:ferrochelatase n=1 Tax=Gordonia sp. (in: high G+C Gram-positive bacteria) TaxID=84139 RepID=UPI00169E0FAC|nr:ferrochelatase [Gordonia sp. (in: high G+C Gram-positive bacteria)]NLG46239.1 ferrochelatase [Gordonia sp. (in: high G+C Gram-positive bacteria)]